MYAHRIETIIDQTGQLNLRHLPFQQGEQVEVIILRREKPTTMATPVFQPFNAVRMSGEGACASEMVIEDRD